MSNIIATVESTDIVATYSEGGITVNLLTAAPLDKVVADATALLQPLVDDAEAAATQADALFDSVFFETSDPNILIADSLTGRAILYKNDQGFPVLAGPDAEASPYIIEFDDDALDTDGNPLPDFGIIDGLTGRYHVWKDENGDLQFAGGAGGSSSSSSQIYVEKTTSSVKVFVPTKGSANDLYYRFDFGLNTTNNSNVWQWNATNIVEKTSATTFTAGERLIGAVIQDQIGTGVTYDDGGTTRWVDTDEDIAGDDTFLAWSHKREVTFASDGFYLYADGKLITDTNFTGFVSTFELLVMSHVWRNDTETDTANAVAIFKRNWKIGGPDTMRARLGIEFQEQWTGGVYMGSFTTEGGATGFKEFCLIDGFEPTIVDLGGVSGANVDGARRAVYYGDDGSIDIEVDEARIYTTGNYNQEDGRRAISSERQVCNAPPSLKTYFQIFPPEVVDPTHGTVTRFNAGDIVERDYALNISTTLTELA